MEYSSFETADFAQLESLQPPNWGPLIPRFEEFIRSPRCHPIKLCDAERMIGVGTSICHEDSAWLACIIVHPDYRNRGLGREITQKLIEALDRTTYSTIYLDATEFGFPVYQKLGFEVEGWYSHRRLQGETPVFPEQKASSKFESQWEQAIFDLDKKYCNEDRSFLLKRHLETAKLVIENDVLQGYYLPGLGDGLIVAQTPQAGLLLLQERMLNFSYAVLPEEQQEAKALLEKHGFLEIRKSRRMYLGKKRVWNSNLLYNRISGQLG